MTDLVVYIVFALLIIYIASLLWRTPFRQTDRTEPLLTNRILGSGIGLNPKHPIGWLVHAVVLAMLIALLVLNLF